MRGRAGPGAADDGSKLRHKPHRPETFAVKTALPLYRGSLRLTVPIMSISSAFLAAFGFGGGELLIILVIIMVLFGGAKLPSLARGLGQSIKEFKKASKDEEDAKLTDTEEKKVEATKTHGTN